MLKTNPIIINTALSNEEGEHWITAYKHGGNVFVYDSLGPRNNRSNDAIIRKRLGRSDQKGKGLHFYPHINQSRKSNICGWLALLVAGYLRKYKPDDPSAFIKARISGDGTDEVLAAFGLKK